MMSLVDEHNTKIRKLAEPGNGALNGGEGDAIPLGWEFTPNHAVGWNPRRQLVPKRAL
ncbi:hypothetical protein D3C83_149520 [compost metagenome]